MPCQPCCTKNCIPQYGFSAFNVSGALRMLNTPIAAIDRNHSTITGPNTFPTLAVPKRWPANRPNRINRLIGTTHRVKTGDTTSRPSTAPSTVMGGVIMPSPKNRAAPKMPRMPTV